MAAKTVALMHFLSVLPLLLPLLLQRSQMSVPETPAVSSGGLQCTDLHCFR